ncbi:MAG: futalosine hydrolase [Acidobacteria bacterium]|nr:futalosine hydrolase [Acidobacteriota bacterium]
MRVLIVAATRPEVEPLVSALSNPVAHNRVLSGILGLHKIDVLLSGVGMVATAVWTTRALAIGGYDLALNLGVCGSFNPDLPPPTVVHIVSESMPELGAEDGPAFLPIGQLGLLKDDEYPWTSGRLLNLEPPPIPALAALSEVAGITVNTVHGDEASIARLLARERADVESMEGAAFAYACLAAGVPFAQVRAVSNRVERRNRAAWDLPGAIAALGRVSLQLLTSNV